MAISEQTARVVSGFRPRTVSPEAARFAREVVAAALPENPNRAKAFLFAASRLAAFGEAVGLELSPQVLLRASVIERSCDPKTTAMSAATRRTVRTNPRALKRRVHPEVPSTPPLSRERAKAPDSKTEIACYLALADAQPTESRRQRAAALICLGAGAGLVGGDLKAVRGTDVTERFGAVVVEVNGGRCEFRPNPDSCSLGLKG